MRVGVVIPSYNRAGYVGRTIESVLRQTRMPGEILVIDDGSTDDTQAVVATFAARDSRVRYHRRPNGGLSAARNTGQEIAEPSCDALLFLDSDDLLEPTALAKLADALDASRNAPLAFCRARYINENDDPLIVPNTALDDEPADRDWWTHLLMGNCIRSAGGVLLRRDALNRMGPWDVAMRSNEDWDMWLRLAESGDPFVRVAEPLLLYRIHGGTLTGNISVQYDTREQVPDKHAERWAHDAGRAAAIRAGRAIFLSNYEKNKPRDGQAAGKIVLHQTGTVPSYDADARRKHHALRGLIERTGLAALHRKTPMAWRIRLRTLFGIDPNA